MSIRLSEKHGVNPSVCVCFWCGEDRGDLVLAGRLAGDREMPHKCIVDYEPCDACQAKMATGITLIEVSDHVIREDLAAINATRRDRHPHPAHYPTGCWCVVTESGARKLFNESVVDDVCRVKQAWVDVETYAALGLSDLPEKEV